MKSWTKIFNSIYLHVENPIWRPCVLPCFAAIQHQNLTMPARVKWQAATDVLVHVTLHRTVHADCGPSYWASSGLCVIWNESPAFFHLLLFRLSWLAETVSEPSCKSKSHPRSIQIKSVSFYFTLYTKI